MKNLLSGWRKYITESKAGYGGILMIRPSPRIRGDLEILQLMLPEEAVRLRPEDFHLTLVHQSFLTPFRDTISKIDLPTAPPILLEQEVFERKSPGKKSWAVRVTNQDDMRDYVRQVMELIGSRNINPEPERVFHISLANMTGNPRDSVR